MFDQTSAPRKRLAVVGGGISGLSAAYYLSARHDVTLYEAAPRLGGHARTVMAGRNGTQPVDTGFIVFNHVTYPHLTRLFRELGVPTEKSEMSFGASIDNGALEYGLNNLKAIAAQKRNLIDPRYWGMIADIVRFGKRAEAAARDDDMTIGELVDALGLGRWFREKYLLPMCGAIWSTPIAEIDRFPARSLVRFFRNHALLAGAAQHQWWTVKGGSIEYVRRLEAALLARGVTIHTSSPVTAVRRDAEGVQVAARGLVPSRHDELILACHADQALAILGEDARPQEAALLSKIRFQTNRAVLHCDPGQMPRRRAAWSSWSYRSQEGDIGVTYWMNRLQNIPDDDPLFVTLNPTTPIAEELVYDRVDYAHPVFDKPALDAQRALRARQGQNRSWFVGAWNRHGFHEDGIASAMRIVRAFERRTPEGGIDHETDPQATEKAVPENL